MTKFKKVVFHCKQRSRFIFRGLTLKKNLKRLLKDYILDVRFIYHKHNPLIITVVDKVAFFKKRLNLKEKC